MTTTSAFQKLPDYYLTEKEAQDNIYTSEQTNPRYTNFCQTHFTVGDEEQFQEYRDENNYDDCQKPISLEKNIFNNMKLLIWDKNKELEPNAVINTFRYIFHKFKKGIFIKIVNNQLKVFLPFSKVNYTNEWNEKIRVDKKKYGNMIDFIKKIYEMEGRQNFNPRKINGNLDEWYGNNCLVRYEYPISEGESSVSLVKVLFEELCKNRKVPDIEFFYNRRDFPIITKDETEPYNNIWGNKTTPLVSHNYTKYSPIFSVSTTDNYADILIPTWDDWNRIQTQEGHFFSQTLKNYDKDFNTLWKDKIETAVFRGGSTGCGVTIETNPRLKISYLSTIIKPDTHGKWKNIPYIDAGITNWNLRPRKIEKEKYLQTINIDELPFGLVNKLTPQEQSKYKYLINIDGHVTAFRLSLELSMGCVILLVDSEWKIWFSKFLVPFEHYIPIKSDLSDIQEKIQWCRENDKECENIATNALKFYNKYLQKDGILDYIQKSIVILKKSMGQYFYNTIKPLEMSIQEEFNQLDFSYPNIDTNINNITSIPPMYRCYGLLKGIEWLIRKIISESNFEEVTNVTSILTKNKLSIVYECVLANFNLVVKSTDNIQKIKEHIHETFIGTKCINNLSKIIPNFIYTMGVYKKNQNYNVISERVFGITLLEYINSQEFNMGEFLFIIIQICLALQIAQYKYNFVHYDLTPWNIILSRLEEEQEFDYIFKNNLNIKIKTKLIPVIIDYGKSYVSYDNIHRGFVNMFKMSTVQDIISLLITSMSHIIIKKLSNKDIKILLILSNFISETKYYPNKFTELYQLKNFLRKNKKYSEIIQKQKYELENKKPIDLINYIGNIKEYKFPIKILKEWNTNPINNLNTGNGRQVFEFILSNTEEQKLNTYKIVFERLIKCTLPKPNNLLFIYFVAQQLEENLTSIQNNLLNYSFITGIDKSQHILFNKFNECKKIIKDTIDFIITYYQELIKITKPTNIDYIISPLFEKLIIPNYTVETFMLPKEIQTIIKNNPQNLNDYSDYREIILEILVNKGVFKLSKEHLIFYTKTFENLIKVNPVNMKNNVTNVKTIKYLSKKIY